jgi:fructose-1,6-bisphosphatase/inositol monophosphatase family enzyme
MAEINLGKVLLCALEACRLAAKIIRDVRERGNLGVIEKGDGTDVMPDPQTDADRRAEALIVGALREFFPTVRIVGEEGALSEASPDWEKVKDAFGIVEDLAFDANQFLYAKDVVIWVDPLDGTNDFVNNRLECVTSLVGISSRGVAVGGLIYRSFSDEALFGGQGLGLWRFAGGEIARVEVVSRVEGQVGRLVTSKTRASSRTDELIRKLGSFEVIKTGGAGWKFWKLLDGTADIYFYPNGGMKLWDICAGDALLRAVGGCLSAPDGEAFVYDDAHLVLQDGLIASACSEQHRGLIDDLSSHF